MTKDKITEIFYIIDEFCKEFDKAKKGHELVKECQKKHRNRKFKLNDSEVITILVLFHLGNNRCLKHYYVNYVQKHMTSEFPITVSYNRFVELQQKAIVPLCCFMQIVCLGKCTGISFVDSTPIRVCHIKRERQNKVFKGLAQKGKCSLGWFYGLKLHIIINDKGEILTFLLTPGNVDDRESLRNKKFHDNIFGKLVGDKGYISHDLFENLFIDGIHLITKARKNMNNCLMHTHDKILLRKRALIETVNDQLKNICQIEHTRHRSFENFISNLIAGLVAYSYLQKKPSLKTDIVDQDRLNLIAH